MTIHEVKEAVEREYGLKAISIEKIKNVYKIYTADNIFCLKVINYEFSHFIFIVSAIKHLQYNGFKKTPEIIKNKQSRDYIKLSDKYAYLTYWIKSRECDYNKKHDVKLAAIKLAELHKKSFGFNITKKMKPRVGWLKWRENFQGKRRDILSFKDIINKKDGLTYFDNLYLKSIDEEVSRIDNTLKHLEYSEYLQSMKKEIKNKGFCHHDYAHHNILLSEDGSINIIDFDYCILDTHLHDLCSLIIRVMKNGKWSINNSIKIIDWYSLVYQIKKDDIKIMAAFIEFPQAFWQVGIQYYREKQPWGEDFFINKLKKIYKDKDNRQQFVDEFRNINY